MELKRNIQYDTVLSVEMESIMKPRKIIRRKEATSFYSEDEDEDEDEDSVGNQSHDFIG